MKICKNSDGFYRVDMGNGWMTDADLMYMISSNHRSRVLTFTSESEARAAIRDRENMLRVLEMTSKDYLLPKEPEYKEDFKEIK